MSHGADGVWRRIAWLLVAMGLSSCAQVPMQRSTCAEQGVAAVPWEVLAPGVWVWAGAVGEISVSNLGHVAPTSVVMDGDEAAVIDPGPSLAHGQRVRRSVECEFRARVRWVVNSHAHAENVLGNAAFADLVGRPGFDIVASPATLVAMQARCPACLASLTARVGEKPMAGTRIVLPSRTVGAGESLAVGRLRLQVMPIEEGHTQGDLVLWSPALRTLWAGGLVYLGRVPELSQGSLIGWLQALDRLDALAPRHVVSAVVSSASPGSTVPEPLSATRRYLSALREGVLQAMDQGHQPQEPGLVPLPAFAHWAGYGERHTFNVQRAWRELEPVWMERAR